MNPIRTNLTYLDPEGAPVMSKTYYFTGHEREIVDLIPEVKAETGLPAVESGLLAVAALPTPDATFIEWLTGGVLTLSDDGSLTGDPSVIEWLAAVREGRWLT